MAVFSDVINVNLEHSLGILGFWNTWFAQLTNLFS